VDENDDGSEDYVHQRTGGDAPQRGAGALRRIYVRHAAEGPEDDAFGLSANLATG